MTTDYCSKKLTSFTEALSKVLQKKDAALDAYNRRAGKDLSLLTPPPSYSGEATEI